MDVKLGYKQTEVGVIPEDWEITTAARLCEFVVDCNNRTPPVIEGGEFAVVRTPNVRDGKFVVENLRFTDESSYRKWTSRAVPLASDVIITREAPLGEVCLVPSDLRVCLGQRMMMYRPHRERADSRFFLYVLMSEGVRSNLLRRIGGSTVGHARVDDIRNLQVPLPPTKSEQEAIAEALSDADALIESLEQIIAKKRNIKQGAMQELLTGKRRLPGFGGGWEMKRLGELAHIRSGGTPSTTQPQFWDGDILWCTPTDITGLGGFKYLNDTSRKISHLGLKTSSAEIIPANSIVMTSRATVGECAINLLPVSTNQGFKNFIPVESADVHFLYYLMLTKKQDFISLCGGSTFLEISKTQLTNFEVSLPKTKAEQTAIAAILSDMDAEIAALEAKLAKARQIKQGMMQQLLTGRTRLI
jgi:type I restriction enzyme S subunit